MGSVIRNPGIGMADPVSEIFEGSQTGGSDFGAHEEPRPKRHRRTHGPRTEGATSVASVVGDLALGASRNGPPREQHAADAPQEQQAADAPQEQQPRRQLAPAAAPRDHGSFHRGRQPENESG